MARIPRNPQKSEDAKASTKKVRNTPRRRLTDNPYSDLLTPEEEELIANSEPEKSLTSEIAILRIVLRRILKKANGDPKMHQAIIRGIATLRKLAMTEEPETEDPFSKALIEAVKGIHDLTG